ncbi:MAG: hypothetical protein LUF87_02595, partial [Alistipes sp.]|nr:hypothetical protein [Alistipes sp.]
MKRFKVHIERTEAVTATSHISITGVCLFLFDVIRCGLGACVFRFLAHVLYGDVTAMEDDADSLRKQQQVLESLLRSEAMERFWERHEGKVNGIATEVGITERSKQGISLVEPGRQFIREKIESVAKRIEDELTAINQGEGGSRAGNLNPFLFAKSMKGIAYLALKEVIDRGCEKIKDEDTVLFQYDLAINAIGRNVALELEACKQVYGKLGFPVVAKIEKEIEHASNTKEKKALTRRRNNIIKRLSDSDFSDEDKARIGMVLLKALLDEDILIEGSIAEGKKTVCLNPQILTFIAHKLDDFLEQRPTWGSLVIPPRPWTTNTNGGYHFDLKSKHKLMREAGRDFCTDNSPEVFAAVNTLQNTSFHINPYILDTALTYLEKANTEGLYELFGISSSSEKDHRLYQIVSIKRILNDARRLRNFTEIFYTCFLDFRGRYYYKATYLDPQGSDLCRALHEFAHPKPLGDLSAVKWFLNHGASCYGGEAGRGTYEDRRKWVNSNKSKILALAVDPFNGRNYEFLVEASKPWMFLAWCHEWAGYIAEGVGFQSRLPVAVDGTCNGMQHLAAMTRSRQLAEKVNLIKSESPSDIYGYIARETEKKLYARYDLMTWYNTLDLDELLKKYNEYGYRLSLLRSKKSDGTLFHHKDDFDGITPKEPDSLAVSMAKGELEATDTECITENYSDDSDEIRVGLENCESIIQKKFKALSINKRILHLQECRRQISECILLKGCPEGISKIDFDRNLVKSIVMTFPYTATHRGNVRSLSENIDSRYKPYISWLHNQNSTVTQDKYNKPKDMIANAIVRLARGCIRESLPDAVCIMDYLKSLLPDNIKETKVVWVSPIGLKVVQFCATPEKINTTYLEYSKLRLTLNKFHKGRKANLNK